MRLRKTLAALTVFLLAIALLLSGCGDKETGEVIKIGATEVPHAQILEFAQPLFEEAGLDVEIVEFSDYIQPNLQLADKQLSANFFQHIPYLEDFSAERNLDLTYIAKVHIEPMGIYPGKAAALEDLAAGSQVGIPNDATNGGRALLLLESANLITLEKGVGVEATVHDIAENPKNLKIVELNAEVLPHSLPDLGVAVINGNFAIQAGLSPLTDSLYLEGADSPYVNVLAVRKDDAENPALLKIAEILTGEEVRDFILEKYEGGVVPVS